MENNLKSMRTSLQIDFKHYPFKLKKHLLSFTNCFLTEQQQNVLNFFKSGTQRAKLFFRKKTLFRQSSLYKLTQDSKSFSEDILSVYCHQKLASIIILPALRKLQICLDFCKKAWESYHICLY